MGNVSQFIFFHHENFTALCRYVHYGYRIPPILCLVPETCPPDFDEKIYQICNGCNVWNSGQFLNKLLETDYPEDRDRWMQECEITDMDAYARMKLLQRWFGTFECKRTKCMNRIPTEIELLRRWNHSLPSFFRSQYQTDVCFFDELCAMKKEIAFRNQFRNESLSQIHGVKKRLEMSLKNLNTFL